MRAFLAQTSQSDRLQAKPQLGPLVIAFRGEQFPDAAVVSAAGRG